MRITIELEPTDLERFRVALARSRRIARDADEQDILDAAKHALNTLPIASAPTYVRKRMTDVQRLIVMLEDDEWALPAPEREDVLESLVYFSDPEDLIPDEIEVIGLLDDAIMLEMLLRHLRHALQAHADFCAYRHALAAPNETPIERHACARKLAKRRDALRLRMRRRVASVSLAQDITRNQGRS